MLAIFIIGALVAFSLIVILKIILQEKQVSFLELLFFAAVVLLIGTSYIFVIMNFTSLSPFVLYFICPVILVFYLLKRKYAVKKSIIVTSGCVLIWTIAEFIVWTIHSIIRENNFNSSNIEIIFLAVIMSLIAISISLFFTYKKGDLIRKIDNSPKALHIGAMISVFILVTINLMIFSFEVVYENVEFSMLILVGLALVIIAILGIGGIGSMWLFIKEQESDYKLKQNEQTERAILYYTSQVEKQSLEIRKFKHDYQNILLSMNGYFEKDDYEGLKNYFNEKIKGSASTFANDDLKLNDISKLHIQEIKSILTYKLMIARESGVKVEFEANEVIDNLNIDTIDLVRIIGILLDNAIEATIPLAEKLIQIGILKKDGNMFLIVKNTCSDNVPKIYEIKERGFSTKGEGRGFGLSNLAELIGKYEHIALETSIIKGCFVQEIVIYG